MDILLRQTNGTGEQHTQQDKTRSWYCWIHFVRVAMEVLRSNETKISYAFRERG